MPYVFRGLGAKRFGGCVFQHAPTGQPCDQSAERHRRSRHQVEGDVERRPPSRQRVETRHGRVEQLWQRDRPQNGAEERTCQREPEAVGNIVQQDRPVFEPHGLQGANLDALGIHDARHRRQHGKNAMARNATGKIEPIALCWSISCANML